MFFLFPFRIKNIPDADVIPFANAFLIALNVLVYFFSGWFGWSLSVGRGSGLPAIFTYGFAHAGPLHLLANLWVLWCFGNPVNRRLGNGYYLAVYLGSLLALGLVARLFYDGRVAGASGAIFAVIFLFLMLLPRARVVVGYAALLPFTLLIGLVWRPRHWVFWFVRWDTFEVGAWFGILLIPLLEIWGLWSWGWNWTNLGHLFGLLCGLVAVLLLPPAITMRRRPVMSGF